MWKLSIFIFITLTSLTYSFSLTSLKDNISHVYDSVISFIDNLDVTDSPDKEPNPKSMNSSELISYYGQPVEEHTVTTADGYILQLFRIPSKGPTVLIAHGLFFSSDDFLALGAKSLPIKSAVLGYDVWLCNFRGNYYSREHQTISPDDKEFWDFSWHEMGTEDLPAIIDYILETTGASQLGYVGHSQGTSVAYVLLSEKPEYNNKLNGMVSLSSVSFGANTPSPVFQLVAKNLKSVESILTDMGVYEVLPRSAPITTVMAICSSSNLLSGLCFTVLFTFIGFDYDQISYENTEVIFGHFPSGTSMRRVIHYFQGGSGQFQYYDYGPKVNLEKYGSEEPPSYELEKISTKMSFIYSKNDWLSNFTKDVKQLLDKLQNVDEIYEVELQSFNHDDYLWGKDADTLVYDKVIELLDKYAGGVQQTSPKRPVCVA